MIDDKSGAPPAGMPPGLDLVRALALVVLQVVPSDGVVEVLQAHQRQLNHEQACTWVLIDED